VVSRLWRCNAPLFSQVLLLSCLNSALSVVCYFIFNVSCFAFSVTGFLNKGLISIDILNNSWCHLCFRMFNLIPDLFPGDSSSMAILHTDMTIKITSLDIARYSLEAIFLSQIFECSHLCICRIQILPLKTHTHMHTCSILSYYIPPSSLQIEYLQNVTNAHFHHFLTLYFLALISFKM
jgi:hypothetical protein